MKFSEKMQKLMETYRLDAAHVCFAALVAVGFSEQESYVTIFRTRGNIASESRKMMNDNPDIGNLIDFMRNEMFVVNRIAQPDKKLTRKGGNSKDKDYVLEQLGIQYNFAREGKEKAEIMMKIADILQVKRQEDKEEAEKIVYYLPLRCENCPAKLEFDKK